MSEAVDYYYTLSSPWTYLGHQRFMDMTAAAGVPVNAKPVNFGAIFPQSGGLPVEKRAPQRQAYRLQELERWRSHLGVPLTIHPKFFPADPTLAARMIYAAEDAGIDTNGRLRLSLAFLRGCWSEEKNIADTDTARQLADAQGFDGTALLDAAQKDGPGQRYEAMTKEATDRQVFGAPTFLYMGQMLWGQDRLDFLQRMLKQ